MQKAASDRGLCFVQVASYERARQSAFVRSRMAMKLGTKMVEAEARVMSARYIVSPVARATGHAGNAALYYNVWCQ
jgi:hypothetical protein